MQLLKDHGRALGPNTDIALLCPSKESLDIVTVLGEDELNIYPGTVVLHDLGFLFALCWISRVEICPHGHDIVRAVEFEIKVDDVVHVRVTEGLVNIDTNPILHPAVCLHYSDISKLSSKWRNQKGNAINRLSLIFFFLIYLHFMTEINKSRVVLTMCSMMSREMILCDGFPIE